MNETNMMKKPIRRPSQSFKWAEYVVYGDGWVVTVDAQSAKGAINEAKVFGPLMGQPSAGPD